MRYKSFYVIGGFLFLLIVVASGFAIRSVEFADSFYRNVSDEEKQIPANVQAIISSEKMDSITSFVTLELVRRYYNNDLSQTKWSINSWPWRKVVEFNFSQHQHLVLYGHFMSYGIRHNEKMIYKNGLINASNDLLQKNWSDLSEFEVVELLEMSKCPSCNGKTLKNNIERKWRLIGQKVH